MKKIKIMETIKQWNENTNIVWQKEARTQLNKVIRKYNKWVENHTSDRIKTIKLLTKIEKHIEMPYSNQDGGSGYKEELQKMLATVQNVLLDEPQLVEEQTKTLTSYKRSELQNLIDEKLMRLDSSYGFAWGTDTDNDYEEGYKEGYKEGVNWLIGVLVEDDTTSDDTSCECRKD